jgi:acyl-CoA thioesterase FadM
MFKETIQPRFNETDALGHVNNTVLTKWFEGVVDPISQFIYIRFRCKEPIDAKRL